MEDEDIGRIRFGAGLVVATTLKVIAVLILVGGAVLAVQGGVDIARDTTRSGQDVTNFVAGVLGTAITSAALLGAAGFALEVLIDSYSQLWAIRYGEDDEE